MCRLWKKIQQRGYKLWALTHALDMILMLKPIIISENENDRM